MARLLLAIAVLTSACRIGQCADTTAAADELESRMDWWRDARFGMFVHWGLYSVAAGEWQGRPIPGIACSLLKHTRMPLEEYVSLQAQFNPVQFDADRLARQAKDAGMKYLVVTAKHHEGFCLFDSQFTDFDVMNTPFRRDILRELAKACRRHGIKLGFYYSIVDWHHPDYLPRRPGDLRPVADADFERYVTYMHNQLRELSTGYGDVAVLWFDGEWDPTWTSARARRLHDEICQLRPGIIINNRIDRGRQAAPGSILPAGYLGDFGTPEQEIPPTGLPGVDWETCMTMNDTWGFNKHDHNWKSAEKLIRMLVDCASKGGNFLLNVDPTAEGLLSEHSDERLRAIEAWMKVNCESIHDTTASPFSKLDWGRCTQKPGKLYLHVFDWPDDGKLVVPGVKNTSIKAHLLLDPNGKPLELEPSNDALTIHLPSEVPDSIDTVVVLTIEENGSVAPGRGKLEGSQS